MNPAAASSFYLPGDRELPIAKIEGYNCRSGPCNAPVIRPILCTLKFSKGQFWLLQWFGGNQTGDFLSKHIGPVFAWQLSYRIKLTMRFSTIIFAGLGFTALLTSSGNSQVVQLPSFRNFSYSGGASIPDSGSASLAGNSYARSGSVSNGWGPYAARASGSSFGATRASASVQIIDLQALDEAILSSNYVKPNARVQPATSAASGRTIVGVSPLTGTAPTADPGKWQRVLAGGQSSVPVHTSLAEADIRFFLKMGKDAESANRISAARVYYRMAVEAMTPEMQIRYAKIIDDRQAALEADLALRKTNSRQQF